MGSLEGRTAVVTGAARGIGRAIAVRFAAEGAAVAILDSDAEAAGRLASEIGARAVAVPVDVGDPASVAAAVAATEAALGAIRVLVNNAAAASQRGDVTEIDLEAWDTALRVNLTGPFLMSRAAIPSMARAGGGSIIHVASQLGRVAVPRSPAYCATKGALLQLARAMALDHAAQGIRVNTLSPGAVLTDRLLDLYGSAEAASEALAPKHPIGRVGWPEDIAGAAVFLASDDSAFMTGADLVVDGGYTAQ